MLAHVGYFRRYVTNPIAQASSTPTLAKRKDGAPSVEMLHIDMVKGGPPAMTTEVVYFPGQKARVLDIAYGLIEHSGEHYGQLVVYYRLAGLVPPESRPKK